MDDKTVCPRCKKRNIEHVPGYLTPCSGRGYQRLMKYEKLRCKDCGAEFSRLKK